MFSGAFSTLDARVSQTLRSESGSLMRGDYWRVLGRSVLVRHGQSLNSEAADTQMLQDAAGGVACSNPKIEKQNPNKDSGTSTC